MATAFEEGFLVGLLVGEGHFGGDGRQPQVTLRMHARHEAMFRWLERHFPGGRLYGPYEHGGRRYYQWMARGAYLRDVLFPLLERAVTPTLDHYAYQRLTAMGEAYARQLRRTDAPGASGTDAAAVATAPTADPGVVPHAQTNDAREIFSALRRRAPEE